MNQTKQLDMYEKSLTPATPKGPKADVIDLSKKLPEDAPYSEKNPTGWMEGLESLKYKVDDLAEQGKKYKETTVGDFIDDYFGMGKKVETEAEMIARMKKQNKDAVKRLKEKKKTKTAEEETPFPMIPHANRAPALPVVLDVLPCVPISDESPLPRSSSSS